MRTGKLVKDSIAEVMHNATASYRQALPTVAPALMLRATDDPARIVSTPIEEVEEQSIAGFTCVIQYGDDMRLIVCRRFDLIGEEGYVGAICHSARGYRQFRVDRIVGVYDGHTGETLGDGSYFQRFVVDGQREQAPTWGLTSTSRYMLICGLNVLAFMSRCDGHWHPLEAEVVERFVCSLWLRKEWEGDAPVAEILAHAERLSPDWETVCRALKYIAQSSTSSRVLKQAVGDLIAADGVICEAEHRWAQELIDTLASFSSAGRSEGRMHPRFGA